MVYDVLIIGAGVVGGTIARLMSQYELNILALEKESDVCCGISKANTGIIHSPVLVHRGTKKAELSLKGNLLFTQLSKELGVKIRYPGALVLARSEQDRRVLEQYKKQGEETRTLCSAPKIDYAILERDELLKIEPSLDDQILCALLATDAGTIIPYEFGIALWENAIQNGVELRLNQKVVSFNREDSIWNVHTENEVIKSKIVINASGHGSNELGRLAGFEESFIEQVKGQYVIYDRNKKVPLNHILFQVPHKNSGKSGKGILVCKTIYNNVMIGPDARWINDSKGNGTDLETLKAILKGAQQSIPTLDFKKVIKTFAGIRPKPKGGDFIIESKDNFIHLCGIESPGLTASPAIAHKVLTFIKDFKIELTKKDDFNHYRDPIVKEILDFSPKELKRRVELENDNPDRIICRCEQVSRSRIIDALNRGIELRTLDAIKRRTRAGQGQCQGKFCRERVRSLMADEYNLELSEITDRSDEILEERVVSKDFK